MGVCALENGGAKRKRDKHNVSMATVHTYLKGREGRERNQHKAASYERYNAFLFPQEVTAVEFHPSALVLASGSKDCTVKLFDISKPSVKKAYRSIQV